MQTARMEHGEAALWLRTRAPPAAPGLRLLCVPYAGGGATVFHSWPAKLPAHVELRAVQLPGRQDRWREPALASIGSIVERVAAALSTLPTLPLVIYGHSMGGLIAFELARRLQAEQAPLQALVVGARPAPQVPQRGAHIHHLPDRALVEALHRCYGTPLAVLQDAAMMALALPSLRSDLAALAAYRYEPGPLLSVPVTVLTGRRDTSVSASDTAAWAALTSAAVATNEVDAGHFFLDTHRPWVLERIGVVTARPPAPPRSCGLPPARSGP